MAKPTKCRVLCPNIGRQKMLFESEDKAKNFIKFNGTELTDDITKLRVYWCDACGGYHISSHEKGKNADKRTDKLISAYRKSKNGSSVQDIIQANEIFNKMPEIYTHKEYKEWTRSLKLSQRVKEHLNKIVYERHPELIEGTGKRKSLGLKKQ